jgi:hypothetical protein
LLTGGLDSLVVSRVFSLSGGDILLGHIIGSLFGHLIGSLFGHLIGYLPARDLPYLILGLLP